MNSATYDYILCNKGLLSRKIFDERIDLCADKGEKKKTYIHMNKCSDCHSHSMPLNGLDGFRCACVIW